MKTKQGDLIVLTPPAAGHSLMSILFSGGTSPRAPLILTREEAAELGRQLVTFACGRRMILVQEASIPAADCEV